MRSRRFAITLDWLDAGQIIASEKRFGGAYPLIFLKSCLILLTHSDSIYGVSYSLKHHIRRIKKRFVKEIASDRLLVFSNINHLYTLYIHIIHEHILLIRKHIAKENV
jgi:hypothetical protein